ncbi:MAG: hypothetical protein L6Q84_33845 [Polyangiaceae bacterium]|nr:hypothetical protein [Polyangiaceae bacterium]
MKALARVLEIVRVAFRPQWAFSRGALAIGTAFVALPELDALSSSTGLGLASRVVVSSLLLAAVSTIEALGTRSSPLVVVLASAVAFAAGGSVVVESGKPHSFYWTLFLLPIFAQARRSAPAPASWAVTAAAPVVVAGIFRSRGTPVEALAAPLAIAVFFPLLYLSVAIDTANRRRVRQERLEWETRAAADRAARARLSATREISHAVSADFAKALASASAVAEALGRGDPEAHALLTQTRSAINDALHTVRETIWALDPDAAEWEVIEPHLRRMVADLGPDGSRLTFAVEPGCLVTSEERVRLARRLRGVLRDSPGPVHARIEQGEGGFRLRLKTPRDAVAPWLNTNGGSPVGAKALEK